MNLLAAARRIGRRCIARSMSPGILLGALLFGNVGIPKPQTTLPIPERIAAVQKAVQQLPVDGGAPTFVRAQWGNWNNWGNWVNWNNWGNWVNWNNWGNWGNWSNY